LRSSIKNKIQSKEIIIVLFIKATVNWLFLTRNRVRFNLLSSYFRFLVFSRCISIQIAIVLILYYFTLFRLNCFFLLICILLSGNANLRELWSLSNRLALNWLIFWSSRLGFSSQWIEFWPWKSLCSWWWPTSFLCL
jgi:hypothetical protein